MFSKAGESKFIREVIFPLLERAIDLAFASTAVIAPAAALAAPILAARGDALAAAVALAVSGAATIGAHARFVAPRRLVLKRVSAPWQPRGLRVAFFTDLHLGRFKRAAWARRVVELVNAQSPDVILLGGDFVGHPDRHAIPDLLAPLAALSPSAVKLAVLGNHDHGIPGVDRSAEIERTLAGFGIRVLRNASVAVAGGLRVAGLGELWAGQADAHRALSGTSDRDVSEVILVLGHNPDVLTPLIAAAPAGLPVAPGRALWLFGHTHGGQIYVPFAPGLGVPITSQFFRGEFDTPVGKVYVSSGCGEAATPTRLGTRPEIVVIDV